MPEGPSILILRELTEDFIDKKITVVEGNIKIEKERLLGQRIKNIRTWGKQYLIELSGFALKVHFLMFGTYRINERKEAVPRLSIGCSDGSELNLYACSIKFIEGDLNEFYDWRVDVLSDEWDEKYVRKKLRAEPDKLVCDALLDQTTFSGVGNIIKNEVLFRIKVHPLSNVGFLPAEKLRNMVEQARQYSFEFLEWKKAFVLKQHWLAHNKKICPRCDIPFIRAHLGKTHRRSFYCETCQKKYAQKNCTTAMAKLFILCES